MNHLGPYLLDRLRAREGEIEIWDAQDAVTGTPVLIFKPLTGAPPFGSLQGVLPWLPCEQEAWVAELPFGAAPLADRVGRASPAELTGWARRLLATLLEMRALGIQHGRISPERIWVKGTSAWLEGLGLPVEPRLADEAAVVEALRAAAGDSWPGWPFHAVLDQLADGRLSLREAAEQLAEPRSVADLEAFSGLLEDDVPAGGEEPVSEDSGTVRIIGRKPATEPAASPEPEAPDEEPPLLPPSSKIEPEPVPDLDPDAPAGGEELASEDSGTVRVIGRKPAASPEPKAPDEGPPPLPPSPLEPKPEPDVPAPPPEPEGAPPARNVVRIEEVTEPAFEVIEPGGASVGRGRKVPVWVWALAAVALVVLVAVWRYPQNTASSTQGYVVDFAVEPPGGKAELVLMDAPEGSQLAEGQVLAVIPGKVYFDAPGVYRIQIRAEGYLPQEKLLDVPPSTRSVTVRLGP
ncbi:hypothetical protein [Oceanithermus sp.]